MPTFTYERLGTRVIRLSRCAKCDADMVVPRVVLNWRGGPW